MPGQKSSPLESLGVVFGHVGPGSLGRQGGTHWSSLEDVRQKPGSRLITDLLVARCSLQTPSYTLPSVLQERLPSGLQKLDSSLSSAQGPIFWEPRFLLS